MLRNIVHLFRTANSGNWPENRPPPSLYAIKQICFFLNNNLRQSGAKNILSRILINSGRQNVNCILESKANYKRKCQTIVSKSCLKWVRVCETCSHFIFFLQSNNQHEFSCTLLLERCFMGEILKSYLTQVKNFER